MDDEKLNAILKNPEGHRFAVIGLGEESGVSAANFLHARGARVKVTELRPSTEVASALSRLHPEIDVETNGHADDLHENCDVAIAAPGVPRSAKVIVGLRQQGVPVCGETELAAWHLKGKIIGITGTKGKSTTTMLAAQGASSRYERVWTGGNLSPPSLDLVDKAGKDDLVVLELSSFQLALTRSLKLDVAVVTNFGDDHLDRYGDLDSYRNDKLRITQLQDQHATMVLPWNDTATEPFGAKARGRKLYFGNSQDLPDGVVVASDHFLIKHHNREEKLPFPQTRFFQSPHNRLNAAAAISALLPLGLSSESILGAMQGFSGLPHRNESLGIIKGAEFINDSLGTNPKAMEAALRAGEGPVRLLAGGIFKGGDLLGMKDIVGQRVAGLYVFGQDRKIFSKAWSHVKGGGDFETMEKAFFAACNDLKAGDEILLSPGCASFDQFQSAKQRGDEFKKMVKAWAQKVSSPEETVNNEEVIKNETALDSKDGSKDGGAQ